MMSQRIRRLGELDRVHRWYIRQHFFEYQDNDELTNDSNLLDSVLMESAINDYLFLRRVCGGTKA